VWRQIQPSDYPLKRGDHVEIDVAALGSYRLWTPSTRRATKVTRIQ
jgi:protein involved in polysaccharide export with SLBB domain